MKRLLYFLFFFCSVFFFSIGSQAQWVQNNGPYGGFVSSLVVNPTATGGPAIFVGTLGGGICRSTNNGVNWTAVDSGLFFFGNYAATNGFAVKGTSVFAGTTSGVYLSTNNGVSWTALNTGLSNTGVNSLFFNGSDLYAGTLGGAFRSTNNGTSWTATGLSTSANVSSFAVIGSNFFVGTQNGGVLISTNSGGSWSPANTGMTSSTVRALAVNGTTLFAGTLGGVFRSTNNGGIWTPQNADVTTSLLVDGSNIYEAGSGVSLSTDNGDSWTPINTGWNNVLVNAIAKNGTTLFAGTAAFYAGIYITSNGGASWTESDLGVAATDVHCLTYHSNGAGGYDLFAGTNENGIYRSTNNGTSWFPVNTSLTNAGVYALTFSGTTLLAGGAAGVYGSTDNGGSWSAMNTGLPGNAIIHAFAVHGSNVFAATGSGVYLSTNDGGNWSPMNSGITNLALNTIATFGANLYAAGNAVYVSTNDGASWTPKSSGITSTSINSIAKVDTVLFVGTQSNGIFKSTDNGNSWNPANTGMTSNSVYCLTSVGNKLIAGMVFGFYQSSDYAAHWTAANTGLPTYFNLAFPSILSMIGVPNGTGGTDIYAGTFLMGIWKRPISQITTVKVVPATVPSDNSLSQNYPNPFNPATTIKFQVPIPGDVSLKVFDLLGREVAVLVNEHLMPGNYEATFDGSTLPSGAYFYRFQSGKYIETRKLVLQK